MSLGAPRMAVIHIEPLPSRTSPGEVLRFIAEKGRIDGKNVGKIVVIGRGATIEVPDAQAAGLVASLDGATLRDRPVRARFAGKSDFTNAGHFGHLSRLLDLEARAEQEEARRRAQAEEGSPVGDGVTLARLALRDEEFGLGGHLLLTFGHKAHSSLAPTRLQPGSPVVLSQTGVNRRMPSYRGVVFDRDERTIGVAIDPPDEDLSEDATWRLDLSPDEVSRLRQQDALQRAAAAGGDRLAELRAVLVGDREPIQETGDSRQETVQEAGDRGQETETAGGLHDGLSPVPCLLSPSRLNAPQRAAIEFALRSKDVAIVHGPPGTGKTTTVVELIRQFVARGETVLACAPSNHAVDNLLEKLLAAGELPVRVGHPARVMPDLRARALDILAEKHPDARQARKTARDAFALFRQADRWTRAKPAPGERAALRREGKELLAEARRLESLAVERVLDEARIICATLTGLDSQVLGQRRFAVAVIDEACQATEPAAWVPLLRVARLVLAGDHCQLPPTIISNEAAEEGLAVSLQERLVGLFGAGIAQLLTVQYRMHEAIMGFSNAEFYGGQLVADESVAGHRLCDLPGVRAESLTERPVQFIDTAGAGYDEELEEDTASRRNIPEADLAARKVRQLLEAGVRAEQVGVIAPYRAQVRALRERLDDVEGLEIDSVDGFQGREKEAIIVSLVRSNPEGEIGFLADERRTNVALTRARRGLIVIGDSATLSHHSFYQRMLSHFEAAGAYGSVWEEPA